MPCAIADRPAGREELLLGRTERPGSCWPTQRVGGLRDGVLRAATASCGTRCSGPVDGDSWVFVGVSIKLVCAEGRGGNGGRGGMVAGYVWQAAGDGRLRCRDGQPESTSRTSACGWASALLAGRTVGCAQQTARRMESRLDMTCERDSRGGAGGGIRSDEG
jgi:hypothetical protein